MADFFGRQQFGTEHFNPMRLPMGQPHPAYYPGFERAPQPGVHYSAANRQGFTTAISGGVLFSSKPKRK